MNIPKEWLIKNIKYLYTTVTGNTPSKKQKSYYGDFIPLIKPPQLKNKPIHKTDEFLSEEGAKKARILPLNSVLVSCIGNLGKTAINFFPVAFNQQLNAIFPSEKITFPKYLFYQAQSCNFRNQLESFASSTTIPIVNKSKFEMIKVILPSLFEQRKIVEIIEELFSELDSGVESLKKAQEQLKVYRQAVLKNAFEGKLTKEWREEQTNLPTAEKLLEEIKKERENNYKLQITNYELAVKEWESSGKQGKKPTKPKKQKELPPLIKEELEELPKLPEGWTWIKIGNIGDVKGGKRLPKGHSFLEKDTDFKYIMAGNLKRLTVAGMLKNISQETFEVLNNYRVIGDEVYITIVGACIGDTGVIPLNIGKVILTENAAKIVNRISIISKYLAYYISSAQCQAYINRKILSATLGKLALNRIENIPLVICKIREQQKIVEEIDSRLSVCDEMERTIEESLKKAESLRQSILKKAFEGKLTEKWREENPELITGENSAEALLKKMNHEAHEQHEKR